MINLTEILTEDPTLAAADEAMVAKSLLEKPRPYLGMSSVGESCQRKTWYRFRFIAREQFDAATLKRFEDGHRTEDLVIQRLRLVDGVTLIDRAPDGNQIGFKDIDGHFSGHIDGDIIGILQAPKTSHVFEAKTCSDKKIAELKKAISDVGEKNALRKWNPTYYTQGMLYCHYLSRTRHYLVVATPGGRDWISVRTDYDAAHALQMIERARRIIKSSEPPERIGKADYFECRWCTFKEICHQDAMPDRTCRSCIHSTPIENGAWHCARWGKSLTLDEQVAGCDAHLFLPKLVNGEIIESDDVSITYKFKDGTTWKDSERGDESV